MDINCLEKRLTYFIICGHFVSFYFANHLEKVTKVDKIQYN